MTQFQKLFLDQTVEITRFSSIVIARWTDAPNGEQMDRVTEACVVLWEECPERSAFLNIVYGGQPKFSDEVRRKALNLGRRGGGQKHRMAHVILMPGILGITVRTFLSTVTLASGQGQRTKIFGRVDDALFWLNEEGADEALGLSKNQLESLSALDSPP